MAVFREANIDNNIHNYIATVGFFCVVSCTILMLRFRGFKASLNILGGNKTGSEYGDVPTVSIKGAYRVNRGEFFDSSSFNDPPKKILPSMVKLPPAFQPDPTERQSKSTSDLTQTSKLPPEIRRSTPEVSLDPRAANDNRESNDFRKLNKKDVKKHEKEQKKLDKQRQEEEKKRDKLAAQEQAKHEKLRKEREKHEALQRAKEAKRIQKENKAKDKRKVKTDTPKPRANPLAQGPHTYPRAQVPSAVQGPPAPQYTTNTLESSISKTSGPPPYSTEVKPAQTQVIPEVVQNKSDETGNTSFGKPVGDSGSSWDMISQHRQQINKQIVASGGRPKQKVMDLQYNMGRPSGSSSDGKVNSEA